jgi:hypothetical protein
MSRLKSTSNRVWSIIIIMSKKNVVFRHDVINIIRIIDKSWIIVRAKNDIIWIIRRILSHQLLCNEIELISLSIEIVVIVHSTKMMMIHFEFVQHEFFDRCFETIDKKSINWLILIKIDYNCYVDRHFWLIICEIEHTKTKNNQNITRRL